MDVHFTSWFISLSPSERDAIQTDNWKSSTSKQVFMPEIYSRNNITIISGSPRSYFIMTQLLGHMASRMDCKVVLSLLSTSYCFLMTLPNTWVTTTIGDNSHRTVVRINFRLQGKNCWMFVIRSAKQPSIWLSAKR